MEIVYIVLIIALFALALIFKEPLTKLINDLLVADIEISEKSFKLKLDTVREKVAEVTNKGTPPEIKKLTVANPVKAVTQSWEDFEKTANTATSIFTSIKEDQLPLPVTQTVTALVGKDILSKIEAGAIDDLWTLKNDAHFGKVLVTTTTANGYANIAYTLADKIIDNIRVKCLHCGKEFPSPINFRTYGSFDSATLEGNQAQCPHCRKMTDFSKENMVFGIHL